MDERTDLGSVGPYRLVRELGRGGQGTVWLAQDERLGRAVALKVLTGIGAASEETLRRFRREAGVASRLDHPGIATIYDTGLANGTPYIAMRYVEGESLARRIAAAREPGGPARARRDPLGAGPASPPSAGERCDPGPASARVGKMGRGARGVPRRRPARAGHAPDRAAAAAA